MNESKSIQVGDVVRHHIYGEGTVRQTRSLEKHEPQFLVRFGERERWLYCDGLKVIGHAAAVRPAKSKAEPWL